MVAKIEQLKNRLTGNHVYPITSTDAVYDKSGKKVSESYEKLVASYEVKEYTFDSLNGLWSYLKDLYTSVGDVSELSLAITSGEATDVFEEAGTFLADLSIWSGKFTGIIINHDTGRSWAIRGDMNVDNSIELSSLATGSGSGGSIEGLLTNDGTVISKNLGFAQIAEWADENTGEENRIGYFVVTTKTETGISMEKATSTSDVTGVTITHPAFAANATANKFSENGDLLPKYDYVGIRGYCTVIDNGTTTVGGKCVPGDDGTAIASTDDTGYEVVSRADSHHVIIMMEPNTLVISKLESSMKELEDGGVIADDGGTEEPIDDIPVDADTLGGKTAQEYQAEIDDAHDKLEELNSNLSHKNLLDNPWFTVNQRGQSEYSAIGYTVDRWYIALANCEIIVDNGISFKGGLDQRFSNNILENGKTYTFSYKTDDKVYSKTFVYDCTQQNNLGWLDKVNVFISVRRTNYTYIRLYTNSSINIHAVKLELGSVSTLAMDTAPNYAEEVMKCSTSTADPSDTYANKPNYATLVSNFEVGVDTIYNACVAVGSTPSENSPTAIAEAIMNGGGGEDISYIAEPFDPEKDDYKEGDYVVKNDGLLYELKDGAWVRTYLSENDEVGGGAPVLLWENPSPTSAFGAQTIELDLSEYSGILIEFNNYGYTKDAVCISREYIKIGEELCGGFSNNVNTASGRSVKVTSTGITIKDTVQWTQVGNGYIIPTKIYGVKDYVVTSNLGRLTSPICVANGFANTSATYTGSGKVGDVIMVTISGNLTSYTTNILTGIIELGRSLTSGGLCATYKLTSTSYTIKFTLGLAKDYLITKFS